MARIKHVRKSRPRAVGDPESHGNATTTVVRSSIRSAQCTVKSTAASIYPSLRPAAIPSMATDRAPPKPMKEHGHHGLRRWMEARRNCDQAGLREVSLLVDLTYENEWFPDNMEEQQKAWYAELKDRWLPDYAPVQNIKFHSLWPSLRRAIIQQIYNDFPEGTYYDRYLSVQWILRLSSTALKRIVSYDDDEMWTTVEDIPEHLLRYRREQPHAVVDPDYPPPRELVKAIRFLKQEHLPGSLLGEWQFDVPDLEAFIVPFCPSAEVVIFPDLYEPSVPGVRNGASLNSLTCDQTKAVVQQRRDEHSCETWSAEDSEYAHVSIVSIGDRHTGLRKNAAAINKVRETSSRTSNTCDATTPRTLRTSSSTYPSTEIGGNVSLCRVKSDADRLWAEHIFNFDIQETPAFLHSTAITSYHAAIQLELYVNWRHSITNKLLRLERGNIHISSQPEYQNLARIGNMVTVQLEETKRTVEKLWGLEQGKTKNEALTSKNTVNPYAAESNNGFGESTRIIPFKATEAGPSGLKRAAPKGETIDVMKAQEDTIRPQSKKHKIDVIVSDKIEQPQNSKFTASSSEKPTETHRQLPVSSPQPSTTTYIPHPLETPSSSRYISNSTTPYSTPAYPTTIPLPTPQQPLHPTNPTNISQKPNEADTRLPGPSPHPFLQPSPPSSSQYTHTNLAAQVIQPHLAPQTTSYASTPRQSTLLPRPNYMRTHTQAEPVYGTSYASSKFLSALPTPPESFDV